MGIKVRYMHSEIKTIERTEIIRDLRMGEFDVLVGINLLREGLDLPEVSLVAILDADKEGFLRSEASLIQTIGRAARNADGTVIMYANTITGSMQRAIDETERRRSLQMEFNEKHGIIPKTIIKEVRKAIETIEYAEDEDIILATDDDIEVMIANLNDEMLQAAENLEFEKAAELRDRIKELKNKLKG